MPWTPPEPSTGAKYEDRLSTKEIAARVRIDIKSALKSGALPQGTSATVRTKYFSGGSSIDVTLRSLGATRLQTAAYLKWRIACEDRGESPERYTPEAKAALKTLEGLLKAYHYDGSDSSVDYFCVNFYGHASIHWEAEKAEVDAAKAHPEDLEATGAREAAATAERERAEWAAQETEHRLYAWTATLLRYLDAVVAESKAEAKAKAEAEAKARATAWEALSPLARRAALLEVETAEEPTEHEHETSARFSLLEVD